MWYVLPKFMFFFVFKNELQTQRKPLAVLSVWQCLKPKVNEHLKFILL